MFSSGLNKRYSSKRQYLKMLQVFVYETIGLKMERNKENFFGKVHAMRT